MHLPFRPFRDELNHGGVTGILDDDFGWESWVKGRRWWGSGAAGEEWSQTRC